MKIKLMAHLISYYPDREKSITASKALISGGVSYLEIQFPFSDPSADGPVIQYGCSQALKNGFTLTEGFKQAAEISALTDIPVYIMSYANPVYTYGVEKFVCEGKKSGVKGFIIPDLPFDSDENLYNICRKYKMQNIPVVIPYMKQLRLDSILAEKPEFIYTAIRRGITGSESRIDQEQIRFLQSLKNTGAEVAAGFGIRNRKQIRELSSVIDCAIAGSVFVEIIKKAKSGDAMFRNLKEKASELSSE